LLGSLLLAAPALADIPPNDACTQVELGKACDNAGDAANQPGTCEEDTCRKTTPDGPMSYSCYLCKPRSGGSAGSGSKADGSNDGGGCSLSSSLGRSSTAALAALAALGLASLRRRRSARG
jgi:hypothetical protein